jgi:ribosomal protein S18 acetylase RimI-like enzyme
MSIKYRPMRPGEEDAVAVMVRQLPKDLGLSTVPLATGNDLRRDAEIVKVTVAENTGLLVGAAVWMIVFSTWRGCKGVYICDLYVMDHLRGRRIGEGLLRATGQDAAKLGARYIKLEVDTTNGKGLKFYERLLFEKKPTELTHFLEPDQFAAFITGDVT